MPNAQLMAALHASTQALREMARDDATYDFVYAHKTCSSATEKPSSPL